MTYIVLAVASLILALRAKLRSSILFFNFFPIWIPRFALTVPSKTSFSIDFWDTCVCRLLDSQSIRLQSLKNVLTEFSSDHDPADLLSIQNDIAKGLSTFSLTSGQDEEYMLSSSWVYTSILIFPEEEKQRKFVHRILEEEIKLSKEFTYMHPITKKFLRNAISQNRICIVSDFEGDERYINEVLSNHMESMDETLEIIASSNHLKNKRSGNLFKYLIAKNKSVKVHIGDNFHADVFSARENGLTAIHAVTITTYLNEFFQKLNQIVKFFVKLIIPSLKHSKEIDILRFILREWRSQVVSTISDKSDLFFIGSEGAFLSHGFIDGSVPYKSAACVSFGRKVALAAALHRFPIQVIARLLVENVSSPEMDNFFEVDFTNRFGESLIIGNISNLNKFSHERAHWSNLRYDKLNSMLDSENPHLIDVGYKATFAYCFNLLMGGRDKVMYSQIFINPPYKSLLEREWISSFQHSSESAFAVPLNTKLIEVLLSLGPRAPKNVGVIKEDLWSNPKRKKLTQLDLWRLMKKPSKKLNKFISDVDLHDDIKIAI